MRILVGIVGGVLVVSMLFEVFIAFLLPRRVKRDPRLVRSVSIYTWRRWKGLARRLPPQAADTMLGFFGPVAILLNLVMWVGVIMLGYACLQWAGGSHLGEGGRPVAFGDDFFFSAATMAASAPAGLGAHSSMAKAVQVVDAVSGVAVFAIVIAYLPALFQAFSSREATVSQLDARAGSPPSAGRLILRTAMHGGWPGLAEYLGGWETWAAELMETHLAYPPLAYFRSQHVNQNWLSAMTTVLDTCVLAVAAAPHGTMDTARFTYAIARHAVVDLSYTFRVTPVAPDPDRLPRGDLEALLRQLSEAGIEPASATEEIVERVTRTRQLYEPYVNALATTLELPLPEWLAPESPTDNWRTTEWH